MNPNVLNRLRQRAGESLGETLAALLIATMGLTMLPGAIVTAARLNKRAEQRHSYAEGSDTAVPYTFPAGGNSIRLETTETDIYYDDLPVTVYRSTSGPEEDGGYCYFYEVAEP